MSEEYIAYKNPFTAEEVAMLHNAMDLEAKVCEKYMDEHPCKKGEIDLNWICASIKKKLQWIDEPERNIPYVLEFTDDEYRIFLSGLSRLERLPQNELNANFMDVFLILDKKITGLKKNITLKRSEEPPAPVTGKRLYFGMITLQPWAADQYGSYKFALIIKTALELFHPDMSFIRGKDNSYTACISYIEGNVEPVFRDLVGELAKKGLFPVFSISEIVDFQARPLRFAPVNPEDLYPWRKESC